MLIASWALLLLVTVVIINRRGHWHTGLFIWGVSIGVAQVLNQGLSLRLIPRLAEVSEKDVAPRRRRSAFQRKLNIVTYVVIGVTIGTLSAKTGFVWVDIAMTVLALASWIVAYMTALAIGRGTRKGRWQADVPS